MNYKNKKINLFSDLRYRYMNFLGKESSSRTIYNGNAVDSYLNGSIDRNRKNKTFTIYFGGDYYFDEKTCSR
ncbi:MAG: hypothetical protein M0D53_03235 [Flavobacterium sp. JAD_PAG50586_2]|nr:MAG: hypothetical protein M0D53_03235 [Flavobacterium sp. JAD_PAG50586_2]